MLKSFSGLSWRWQQEEAKKQFKNETEMKGEKLFFALPVQ
jgi:hypothetical protein